MRCVRRGTPAARSSVHRPLRDEGPDAASRFPMRVVGSVFWRDAQAGVPSAEWPRAQLAFKDSMVRGILQFTPGIAFRYVLHRCESRDIRCRESYRARLASTAATRSSLPDPVRDGRAEAAPRSRSPVPWRPPGRRGSVPPAAPAARGGGAIGDATVRPGPSRRDRGSFTRSRVFPRPGLVNDPSAGSPTETLLRLLLPLNDKVQWTSHDVAGSEPPTSPRSEHFTGPFNR